MEHIPGRTRILRIPCAQLMALPVYPQHRHHNSHDMHTTPDTIQTEVRPRDKDWAQSRSCCVPRRSNRSHHAILLFPHGQGFQRHHVRSHRTTMLDGCRERHLSDGGCDADATADSHQVSESNLVGQLPCSPLTKLLEKCEVGRDAT